jgi:hypothetical protein
MKGDKKRKATQFVKGYSPYWKGRRIERITKVDVPKHIVRLNSGDYTEVTTCPTGLPVIGSPVVNVTKLRPRKPEVRTTANADTR